LQVDQDVIGSPGVNLFQACRQKVSQGRVDRTAGVELDDTVRGLISNGDGR
jgi:hypothetical protein